VEGDLPKVEGRPPILLSRRYKTRDLVITGIFIFVILGVGIIIACAASGRF